MDADCRISGESVWRGFLFVWFGGARPLETAPVLARCAGLLQLLTEVVAFVFAALNQDVKEFPGLGFKFPGPIFELS